MADADLTSAPSGEGGPAAARARSGAGGAYRPLAGLRVVDLADVKAETCGRLLADLGADVVRVEPPEGAASRRVEPVVQGEGLYFEVRNANKRGVTADLSHPAGREVVFDLLGLADILVETGRPDDPVLGVAPAELSRRFPRLVVVSVTDFGHTGPYRDFAATDAVMEAMGWMLFRAGEIGLPPVLPPVPLAYDTAGVTAAFVALTAYLDRGATGAGQWIDLSVMEAAAQTTDWGLTMYSVISRFATYGEMREGAGKAYPVLPCRDGHVRMAVVTVGEWRKYRKWLGEAGIAPEVIQQDHWDDQRTRLDLFEEVLRPYFEEFYADKDMLELAREGQARGLPLTPMLGPAQVLAAEQFEALGTFVDGVTSSGAKGRCAGGFFTVDGERVGYRDPAPPAPAAAGSMGVAGSVGAAGSMGSAVGSPASARAAWPAPRVAPPASEAEPGRPYRGLRVVLFGVAGAVPEMGHLLAEYGADVIRVENPARPDMFRQLGGPSLLGPIFVSSNRALRSIAVDFADPAGVAIIRELVGQADVILENLPCGTLERYGLGADELRRLNPEAPLVSTQTMGRHGPWAHWRGYGSNCQLAGGLGWLWTLPEAGHQVSQNVAFPDHLVGRLGATFLAADLIGRRLGQRGAGHVEIVQAEVVVNALADLFLQESLAPGSVRPRGNRSSHGAPWGVYPCAGDERWCVVTCRDDADWAALVDALGRPAWALDDRFATAAGRRDAHDLIDQHLGRWTAARSDREVMEQLQAHGVPCGMMLYISDHATDPHLRDRGYVVELDQPTLGPVLAEGPAFRASRLPRPISAAAPRHGEHSRQVCTELLGRSEAEVGELVAAGVLIEADPPAGSG